MGRRSRRSRTPTATSSPGCIPTPTGWWTPWTSGTIELGDAYRGITGAHRTPLEVRIPGTDARFGILSDVDDTILETGVQRASG